MEKSTKLEEKQNLFLQLSSSSAASHINNGKITINNSYPPSTTFIQADTSSFKQVVQFLTGSSKHATKSSHNSVVDPVSKSTIPPIKNKPRKQGLNLFERRNNSFKNTIRISPFTPGSNFNQKQNSGFSPRDSKNIELLSPSILNFPSLVLSPVTPLLHQDSFNRSASTSGLSSPVVDKEDKEIAEKGFYLHPSSSPSIPNTPRDSEPQLLSLFPLTSPRFSGSPTTSSSSS
ncbi:VQ motif-containing protein 4-like [Papaver somniferum]|uniref:VQ motif-containing protein 4-like n=1 Tax=Papaver somniferum TaxID=3469 RepID=UPI000E6F5154|nr:VQ motif-containing protein 4-like [Papaver somniferum]